MNRLVCFYLLFCLSSILQAGITAEQILGEYWNDPLFGLAATDQTLSIEVLDGRFWPNKISVPLDTKVRIIVLNKTDDQHLIAFSQDLSALKARDNFKKFVDDEIFHASQKKQQGASHSHSGTNAGGAQSIVKTIDENPTVFVKAGDIKETLVLFDSGAEVSFSCVIDAHQTTTFTGIISIE